MSQLALGLRLHFRNRMALLYGYLFPTIFLAAFWALYRFEQPPLARHMGELLTVTALGGACFGLPTALVSERERGVWRRYRLAPVSTVQLIAGTLLSRYLLLLTAGALQVALAMAIGAPLPDHPVDLLFSFTLVCFAFLGVGLVIAMLADNVPAVQALGQCIFLPMLIIGGVAVRLASLPEWAQHLSAFFPGRYAVESIQASVTGSGVRDGAFAPLALLLIGLAGCVAGTKLFRWDAQQRFLAREGKGWLAVALGAWLLVGLGAEARERVVAPSAGLRAQQDTGAVTGIAFVDRPAVTAPAAAVTDTARVDSVVAASRDSVPASAPPIAADSAPPAAPEAPAGRTWRDVTMADIDLNLVFVGLPPDDGVVAPIGRGPLSAFPGAECVRDRLASWPPGAAADPVQRVRNHLFLAAAVDVMQLAELEPGAPLAVFDRLRATTPRDDLVKILYWIATHPDEGSDGALGQLTAACVPDQAPPEPFQVRDRTTVYAVKLLGRLLGKIPGG